MSDNSIEKTVKQLTEEDIPELELVEVPKVLGDVFEALIGAIFIDSGHNLELVWSIYRKLCPGLEDVVRNPPQNFKKELLEKYPGGKVKFGKAIVEAEVVFVDIEVDVGDMKKKFRGRGKNKNLATLAACKCALRMNC